MDKGRAEDSKQYSVYPLFAATYLSFSKPDIGRVSDDVTVTWSAKMNKWSAILRDRIYLIWMYKIFKRLEFFFT